jgi:hypothetical protein
VRRAFKWLAWIVGVPVVGFALLVAFAFWTVHQREARFARLPPGERQLAIYDAFARLVELNYYDQEFIEQGWPALRDEWRVQAEKSRDDFNVYFRVLLELTQKLPSSHLAAVPPARVAPMASGEARHNWVPGDGGFEFATVRRGKGTFGVVDTVTTGSAAAVAGIEPG